jgi:hypothetical protein
MTEEEWSTVVAPEAMLAWVAPRCTERMLRLFALACCRNVASRLRRKFERALLAAEGIAESATDTSGDCGALARLASMWMTSDESGFAHALSNSSGAEAAYQSSERAIDIERRLSDRWWQQRWFQAECLSDIVGNPFRPVAFSAQWRTSTAVAIAQGMYGSRDFSPMPILADSLQDAGCDNDDILNHCRDPRQVHVRGCWVVDLVLGKS